MSLVWLLRCFVLSWLTALGITSSVRDVAFAEMHGSKSQPKETCNPSNIRSRVDFSSMPPAERKSYISAIKCLMTQPSSLDNSTFPAATNRFFDYAVIHTLRTSDVHLTGFFLTWHRYFLYLFEQDLRNVCNYTGHFPYWNFWASSTAYSDIHSTTILNGDEFSMSGDGQATSNDNSSLIVISPNITIPHGTGGGCVTTGPFANLTTPLRSVDLSVLLNNEPLPVDTFAYHPACLTRDLNQLLSLTYTTAAQVSAAVQAPDIDTFQALLNGLALSPPSDSTTTTTTNNNKSLEIPFLGVHTAAHFLAGGTMNSIHTSPQDPLWFPLHTAIDLLYTAWQIKHPDKAHDLSGTTTPNNIPPSYEVTEDFILPDWGELDESAVMVQELLDTQKEGGRLCYRYDTSF